jgi:predicted Zn finger-like uncharacterized protein
MDVTCDKCRTEYEFDDSLISESGTTVKCTNCGHLFRIYKPGTPEAKKKPAWMLRQPDGSVYTFERMTTLQRWIAEGKVSREDKVSRTGEGWQTLGSMKELAPFFETAAAVLDEQDDEDAWGDDGPTIRRSPTNQPDPLEGQSVRTPAAQRPRPPGLPSRPAPIGTTPRSLPSPIGSSPGAPPAAGSPPSKPAIPPIGQRIAPTPPAAPRPADVPAAPPPPEAAVVENEDWSQGALLDSKSPAWIEDRDQSSPHFREAEPAWTEERISALPQEPKDEDDEPHQPRGKLLKVGVPILVIGFIAAGIAGLFLFRPDLFHQLASQVISESAPSSSSETYLRGREYFLLDTTEGFRQADREYHRSKSGDGLSQAGLAEVYTTWSQYYLDEVADDRLMAENASETDALALRARADIRQDEFQQKLEQARRFVDAALEQAQGTVEAHRAAADYYRLTGDISKARQHISRALQLGRDNGDKLPETQYVEALVELTDDHDTTAAIRRLNNVIEGNSKLIRCHYRLARLQAASNDHESARQSLEAALALNKEHVLSREMLESLIRSEPPLVAVTSTTIGRPVAADQADGGPAGDADVDGAPDTASAVAAVTPDAAASDGAATSEPTKTESGAAPAETFDAIVRRATTAQTNGSSEACALFRQADRLRSGHPEVLVGLGYCATDQGNRSQAISLFRRALSSSGSYGPAMMALASAYRSQGDNRRALEFYRRYVSAHPSGSQAGIARRNISQLEETLGESEAPASAPEPTPTPAPTESSDPPAGREDPPASQPPSTPQEGDSGAGSPEAPTVIRVTEERPPEVQSDSLATDSEPPLRPGENLD